MPRTALALTFLMAASAVAATTTFLGPSAYLSVADSPFSGVSFSFFHLEDFEDAALNESGLSASVGLVLFPGPFRDSVDADDGVIDGSGQNGHAWYVNASSVTFSFDEGLLGALPTHAGVVWTDVGAASPTEAFDSVTFEAFDAGGVSLGTIGPVAVGDGFKTGQTAEDRFFGVINGSGISSIKLTSAGSTDWAIDHVQYGQIAAAPVPGLTPAAMLFLAGLLFALAFWRLQRYLRDATS